MRILGGIARFDNKIWNKQSKQARTSNRNPSVLARATDYTLQYLSLPYGVGSSRSNAPITYPERGDEREDKWLWVSLDIEYLLKQARESKIRVIETTN